jgi:beta-fructofuranosidase
VTRDPAFPRLHGRPQRGWVNDPHGCVRIDGRYHVFFQHNPDEPRHNAIKWGHISSPDLVHWQQEPIALTNRPGELDQHGCWTGCMIDDDGVPTAIYSAVADASGQAQVLLARSDRHLQEWRQAHRAIAPALSAPELSHARDPFIFELDGQRYAVQGAGHAERPGAARILTYACDDLTSWTELGSLVTSTDPIAREVAPAHIWECPNLVRFDERWVLIVSLWRPVGDSFPLGGVRYLVGEMEPTQDGPRFTPTSGGRLDNGPSFYAPHVMRDGDRALMWAWSWEHGRSQQDIDKAGWAGTLTFCRELQLIDDVLVSRPAPELARLRDQPLDLTAGNPFQAAAFDIEFNSAARSATLALVERDDERPVAQIDLSPTPTMQPRILVDGSIVEIFDGSGASFTTRAYPTAASAWIIRLAQPAPIEGWTLKPQPESPDRMSTVHQ